MGLDMYLTASIYLYGDEYKDLKKSIQSSMGITKFEPKNIEFEVGYWRKANQIHKWFVDNIQDGKDDCGTYYVPEEKLEELLKLVNASLASTNPSALLPTQEGFFFGGTAYDEYYVDDLKNTREIINRYLRWDKKDQMDLHYHSSW